jgi:hypothetical protein
MNPDARPERGFDCLMTVLSNGTLVFVCNKTSTPGWGVRGAQENWDIGKSELARFSETFEAVTFRAAGAKAQFVLRLYGTTEVVP